MNEQQHTKRRNNTHCYRRCSYHQHHNDPVSTTRAGVAAAAAVVAVVLIAVIVTTSIGVTNNMNPHHHHDSCNVDRMMMMRRMIMIPQQFRSWLWIPTTVAASSSVRFVSVSSSLLLVATVVQSFAMVPPLPPVSRRQSFTVSSLEQSCRQRRQRQSLRVSSVSPLAFIATATTTTTLRMSSSTSLVSQSSSAAPPPPAKPAALLYQLNLSTVSLLELQELMVVLQAPNYRAKQIHQYIRQRGINNINDMVLLPQSLRHQLLELSNIGTTSNNSTTANNSNGGSSSLKLVQEDVSRVDGTIKRVYELPTDGALIESVLMGPYNDGRYTACISSQVGCAQGCVFCATGQMGLSRQLTANEIFEQVAIFHALLLQQSSYKSKLNNDDDSAVVVSSSSSSSSSSSKSQKSSQSSSQLHGKSKRLSNVVFMGMGEPLANYKNVMMAVQRIIEELGIGARRITISTVGIVPMIRKITSDSRRSSNNDDDNTSRNIDHNNHQTTTTGVLPQFRLAISLHSAIDHERTALLPANARNGGLNALMEALHEYSSVTGRRITIEWALIAGQNDNVQTAQQLGRLLVRHSQFPLRPDLVHVNVIPLNPTAMFDGKPSQTNSVNIFCQTLQNEFGISCTPRVRRGIDIDAGCGQLTTKYRESQQREQEQEQEQLNKAVDNSGSSSTPVTGTTTMTLRDFIPTSPVVGVYDDDDEYNDDIDDNKNNDDDAISMAVNWEDEEERESDDVDDLTIELIDDDNDDPTNEKRQQQQQRKYKNESDRLISLVQGTTINLSNLEPQ